MHSHAIEDDNLKKSMGQVDSQPKIKALPTSLKINLSKQTTDVDNYDTDL
jgi:hypothetical protein